MRFQRCDLLFERHYYTKIYKSLHVIFITQGIDKTRMKMVRLTSIVYVVLLLWWQTEEANSNPLLIAGAAAEKALVIGLQLLGAADIFRTLIADDEEIDIEKKEEAVLFTGLEKIDNHISKLHDELSDLSNELRFRDISEKMRKIHQVVDYVNRTYNNFVVLTQEESCIERSTLEKLFVDAVWGYNFNNLESLIAEMHSNFIAAGGAKTDSLLALISKDKSHLLMCNREQSNQQTIYQIYKTIINTDLKALALRLASLDLIVKKAAQGGESTKKIQDDEHNKFKQRITDLANAVEPYLHGALNAMWRCDPNEFVEGKSYSKLQQIFQAMVLNEQDTTANTCRYSACSEMSDPGAEKLYFRPNEQTTRSLPSKLHCDGYVTGCVDASTKADYCQAREGDDRRYTGLKYGGKTYGENFEQNSCRRRFGRFDGYTYWFHYCAFCLCTCVSTKVEVDRHFSLKMVTTNVARRMVITGVHLRLLNHVFYIDIREGRLGANGTIEPGSTKWRNASAEDKIDFYRIMDEAWNEFEVLPSNDEVYTVTWGQKTVYLDDIDDKSGDVVLTGIGFYKEQNALRLHVRHHTFVYETGEIGEKVDGYKNKRTTKSRGNVAIRDGDYPFKKSSFGNKDKNNAMSRSGTFLEFTTTSREKDLSQFTVPFIDTQEVAPEPPTPLSGAGLYHKGKAMRESGGLLGLKVFQLPFLKTD